MDEPAGSLSLAAEPCSAPAVLLLFTKNPVPGKAKTRLIGDLTATQAAEIHGAFVGDVVDELSRGSSRGRYRLEVAWSLDDDEEPDLDILPVSLPVSRQSGEDLGERLYRALEVAARTSSRVGAIGSDHPGLDHGRIQEAFQLLDGDCDIVLGPATDGGYYLIAVRAGALDRELFDGIRWSSPVVLTQTLERCRRLGLRVELLPEMADVDTPADLLRLISELRADPTPCPRTSALLERWGRL